MKRILAGLIIAGLMMIIGGIDGLLNSRKYPSNPQQVDLAKLELGQSGLDVWHLKITNAIPLTWLAMPASVGVADRAPNGPHAQVIFPIASESNTYITQLRAQTSSATSGQGKSQEPDPRKASFALFVRSTQLATTTEPPDPVAAPRELTGVILNDLDGIPSKDLDELRSTFGIGSQTRVLVLEHGRQPPSLLKAIIMLVLGPGMFVLAVVLLKGRNLD